MNIIIYSNLLKHLKCLNKFKQWLLLAQNKETSQNATLETNWANFTKYLAHFYISNRSHRTPRTAAASVLNKTLLKHTKVKKWVKSCKNKLLDLQKREFRFESSFVSTKLHLKPFRWRISALLHSSPESDFHPENVMVLWKMVPMRNWRNTN